MADGIRFGHRHDAAAPIKGKIDAERNERAEDCAEHAALAHVKPVGFDLDDGHRAVALEIHVRCVNKGKGKGEMDFDVFDRDEIGQDAQRDIADGCPERGDDDAAFAAEFFIDERAVDEKRERVHPGAHAENNPEILFGHQGPKGILGNDEIIASHAKEGLGHAEREPIDEAPDHEPAPVAEGIVIKIQSDNDGETDTDENQRALRRINELQNARHAVVLRGKNFCLAGGAPREAIGAKTQVKPSTACDCYICNDNHENDGKRHNQFD